jgi:hypothetical protein
MIARCENQKSRAYPNYGGHGITVCARWHRFENFLEDMGEKPEGLSLELENNEQGYCKSNCKWATATEQSNNRRSNVLLEHEGQKLTIAEWARITGIPAKTLGYRIRQGWAVCDALSLGAEGNNHYKRKKC